MGYTTASLTGKQNNSNSINLSGKQNTFSSQTSQPSKEIIALKTYIMNIIIIPLLSKQWVTLNENKFLVDIIKGRLNKLYLKNKSEDISLYINLLDCFDVIIYEHLDLVSLEEKVYGNKNNMLTAVYKTALVKLKPEYELYNLILGKPTSYNLEIINTIKQLVIQENITFDKIKENILAKFSN